MEAKPKYEAGLAIGVALTFLALVFLVDVGLRPAATWASLYGLAVLATLWVPGRTATFAISAVALALAAIGPQGGMSASDVSSRAIPCVVVFLSSVTVLVRKELGRAESRRPTGPFQAFIDAAPIFVWACDENGRVTYVNDSWSKFTGLSQSEVRQRGWQETVHPEDLDAMERAFEKLRVDPRPFSHEFRMRSRDGTYRWVFEQANPLFAEDRTFLGFLGNSVDVSDRRLVEDELRSSRETLEKAQEIGRIGTWRFDTKTNLAEWSPQVYSMCGLDAAEWDNSIGWFLSNVLHPSERERFGDWAERILAGEAAGRLEYRIVRRSDGAERWVLSQADAFRNAAGVIVEVVGISQDVTDARLANAALAENRARLTEAERIAGMGHAEWDPDTGEVIWSEGLYRLLGVEPDTVVPGLAAFSEFVRPADRESLRLAVIDAVKRGHWKQTMPRIVRSDGSERIIQINGRVAQHALTGGRRLFSILKDVTEVYRTEEALRASEAFLSKAQEIARLGSWTFDTQTGVRTWSRELYRICGLSPDSPVPSVEHFTKEIVHPEDRVAFESGWQRVVEDGAAGHAEYRIIHPDGTVRIVSAQCEVVSSGGDRPSTIIGTFQDVTEVRRAQTALQASQERFDLAARGANDGLWDWSDVRKDELWISPRYFELLGYDDGAFVPNGENFMGSIVHPDDRERNWEAIVAHLEHGTTYDVELRFRMRNGRYRWFQTRGQAIFSSAGAPVRMAGSAQDIHDRKLAEIKLEQYREQLRTLTWKAALAGEQERRRIGIELHDRTIQNLGLMRVRLAELRGSIDTEVGGRLFNQAFSLVKDTIRDTRALLSELSPPVLYELGFESGVDWLAERIRTQHGLSCSVTDDGLHKPLSEDAQVILFQAVRELLGNAAKHAQAEHVVVSVRKNAEDILITIEDDGNGFDVGETSFEMTDEGGFGLFSIRERMAFLGGELALRSEPGSGTIATLRAPLMTTPGRAAERVA